ncbi:MAG: ATP-binding protein [Pseudomonadota bacterium]
MQFTTASENPKIKTLIERIEFILDVTKTGIDIIDADFNIRYLDSARKKRYGEIADKKCYEYFMDSDQICPGCGLEEAMRTKKAVFAERILVKEDNRPVQITTIPFQSDRGEWLFAEVNVDITKRRHAEDALKQYAERLRILRQIDRAILEEVSSEKIAQASVKGIRQIVPCSMAGVITFDSELQEVCILGLDSDVDGVGKESGRLPCYPDNIPIDKLTHECSCLSEDVIHSLRDRILLFNILWDKEVRFYATIPLVLEGCVSGILILGARQPESFLAVHFDIAREVADVLSVGIRNAWLFKKIAGQREQLNAFAVRLDETEEIQKQKLAQELHDQVGQNLAALNINLNIIHREILNKRVSAKLKDRVNESLQMLADTTEQIRDVMAELRPPVLDDYGLFPALRWYCERFQKLTGVDIVLQCVNIMRLPQAQETALFRIAQESLVNAVKHAQPGRITVGLKETAFRVRLMIEDDGVGFNLRGGNDKERIKSSGWGLITMRQRAAAVGADITINSRLQVGTCVTVEIDRGKEVYEH